jgi:hypothetical protein
MDDEALQRDRSIYRISLSMSACMRSLNSSDQWASGFDLLLFFGFGDLAHGCANGVEGAATASPEGETGSRA